MNKTMLLTSIIMLSVGFGVGYWLSDSYKAPTVSDAEERKPLFYRNSMNPSVTSPVPAKDSMGMDYVPVYAEAEKKASSQEILFYRSPMNPSVTSPVPAKDTMGMDYVPVYANDDTEGTAGTVEIDPVVVQNIGVRTAVAKQMALSRTIRAAGRVDFDEERMARIHSKVEGWIEEIQVDKTGQSVKKGDVLLSIYSPKLVSTQQEYLLALNSFSVLKKSPIDEIKRGAEELVKSSRKRLQLLDVPEHQIRELEQSREVKQRLHIHSSVPGTVIRIGSRQGQYVTPKTELYMLVDLSQVWVYADVYEYELPWIKIGDAVEMTLASAPGKTFKGELAYIYPYAESKTRTTKVRLIFDNRELLLRPEMFSEVIIRSDTQEDAVVIPAEAVIRSGDRTQVFVVRGPGKFEPRVVKLGIESSGQVAVLDGIQAGDEVVTSAQFLVDSESKLREATAKMMDVLNTTEGSLSGINSNEVKDHSEMDMGGVTDMMTTDSSDSGNLDRSNHGAQNHD